MKTFFAGCMPTLISGAEPRDAATNDFGISLMMAICFESRPSPPETSVQLSTTTKRSAKAGCLRLSRAFALIRSTRAGGVPPAPRG